MTLKDLLPYMDYHTVSIYADTKKGRIFIGDICLKDYKMFVSENILRTEVVSILDGEITIDIKQRVQSQSGLDTETHSDIEELKCAMVNVKVLCKESKYYSKKSDKDIAMIERLVNKEIEKVENGRD